MIFYLDTSAFIKRYLEELGSQELRKFLKKKGYFFTSKIAYVEVLMTFRRKKTEGFLSDEDFLKLTNKFEKDWLVFNIIELSNEIIKTLKEKVFKHPLKALDAIHLSSALWLKDKFINVIFVCSDYHLKEKAKLEKLSIWDPCEEELQIKKV